MGRLDRWTSWLDGKMKVTGFGQWGTGPDEKLWLPRTGECLPALTGVALMVMDVENLFLADNTFDSVLASFVFCSVPNPVRGLSEVQRVCKAGGKVVLLEHVRSANALLGWLMDVANPLVVRLIGANINRHTVENVAKGGLKVEQVTDLWGGIFKLIEARKVASG